MSEAAEQITWALRGIGVILFGSLITVIGIVENNFLFIAPGIVISTFGVGLIFRS